MIPLTGPESSVAQWEVFDNRKISSDLLHANISRCHVHAQISTDKLLEPGSERSEKRP